MSGTIMRCARRLDGRVQAQHADYVNAMSNHQGGANVLMADGSVRFLENTASVPTWPAIGTECGGEIVSSDAD